MFGVESTEHVYDMFDSAPLQAVTQLTCNAVHEQCTASDPCYSVPIVDGAMDIGMSFRAFPCTAMS